MTHRRRRPAPDREAPSPQRGPVLHYLGEDGYRDKARQVIKTRQRLEAAINTIDELRVVGHPQLGLIAYSSNPTIIHLVADRLFDQGWFSPRLDDPPAIHLMLSPEHSRVLDDYIADLRRAVNARLPSRNTKPPRPTRYN